MPITAKALKRLRKATSFEYLGEMVNIEYYPSAISSESVEQLRAIEKRVNTARDDNSEDDAMAALDAMAAWVCALVASWDYMEDDESAAVPITPERMVVELTRFADFIGEVVAAAIRDKSAGNASGTTPSVRSGATSSPVES